jgi:hypothetical protein
MHHNNYACFTCRRGFKHGGVEVEVRCPQCGGAATNMGTQFKVPPRHAEQQWRKVALLANAGVRFDHSPRSWLPERPVQTYAQAKRVVQLVRARHDATLAAGIDPQAGRKPQSQRGQHKRLSHTAKRHSAARTALREARAARALALIRGDSDRLARIERQIALLDHHLATLQAQQHRERR